MKPGVFSQLHIHLIFAVKYRECLLKENIRDDVFAYIGGIIKNRTHKSILVNGVSDHIHILIGQNPSGDNLSQLVASIKRDSSFFINNQNWFNRNFHWQEGYGAFAFCKSHLDGLYHYVINQEEHHRKKTFREEYIEALEKAGIEYDERFLFSFFDLKD